MQAGLVTTPMTALSCAETEAQIDAQRSPSYFTHFLYRLAAPADAGRLEHAWRTLVNHMQSCAQRIVRKVSSR